MNRRHITRQNRIRPSVEHLESRYLLSADASSLTFSEVIDDSNWLIAETDATVELSQPSRFQLSFEEEQSLVVRTNLPNRYYAGNISIVDWQGEVRVLARNMAYARTIVQPGTYELVIALSDNTDPTVEPMGFVLTVEAASNIQLYGNACRSEVSIYQTDGQTVTTEMIGAFGACSQDNTIVLQSVGIGTHVDVEVVTPTWGTLTPKIILSGSSLNENVDGRGHLSATADSSGKLLIGIQHDELFYAAKRYSIESQSVRTFRLEEKIQESISVGSEDELNFLLEYIDNGWIGLRVVDGELSDQWGDGSPVDPLLLENAWENGMPHGTGYVFIQGGKLHVETNSHSYHELWTENPISPGEPANSFSSDDAAYLVRVTITDQTHPSFSHFSGFQMTDGITADLIHEFTPHFSEPVLSDSDFTSITSIGVDGIWNTDDDIDTPVETAHQTVRITNGPLPDGQYRIHFSNEIRDRAGNQLEGPTFVDLTVDAIGDRFIFEGINNESQESAAKLTLVDDPNGTGFFRTEKPGRGSATSFSGTENADFWAFDAKAGDVIFAETSGAGSSPNYLRQRFSMITPDGTVRHPNRIYPVTLSETGTYYIRVEDNSKSQYKLSVFGIRGIEHSDLNGDYLRSSSDVTQFPFAEGDSQRVGAVAGALIGSGFYVSDSYDIGTVQLGSEVSAIVSIPNWSDLNPLIELVGQTSRSVFTPQGSHDRLVVTVPETDEYKIEVIGRGGGRETSEYRLDVTVTDTTMPSIVSIDGLPDESTPATMPIGSFNVQFDELISPESLADGFQLQQTGPDNEFDTPDDVLFPTSATLASNGTEAIVRVEQLLTDGSYRFRPLSTITDLSQQPLRDDPANSRFFSVAVNQGQFLSETAASRDPENAINLALVKDTNGTELWHAPKPGLGQLSSDPNAADWWEFEASEGQFAKILYDRFPTIGERYGSIDLVVFGPSGIGLLNASHGVSTFQIPETGTFKISVANGSTSTQAYQLRVLLSDGESFLRRRTPSIRLNQDGLIASAFPVGTLEYQYGTWEVELGTLFPSQSIEVSLIAPDWSPAQANITVRPRIGDGLTNLDERVNHFFGEVTETSEYKIRLHSTSVDVATLDSQYLLEIRITTSEHAEVIRRVGLPDDGATTNQLIQSFSMTFDRGLDRSSVKDSGQLIEAGEDQVFGTPDDVSIDIQQHELRHPYEELSYTHLNGALQPGYYQFSLDASVRDVIGQPLAEDKRFETQFTVVPLDDRYVVRCGDLAESHQPILLPDPALSIDRRISFDHIRRFRKPGVGVITSKDSTHHWEIEAEAGEFISVWMIHRTGSRYRNSSWNFSVSDTDGVLLNQSGSESSGLRTAAYFQASQSGIHTIEVNGPTRDSGESFVANGVYELWVATGKHRDASEESAVSWTQVTTEKTDVRRENNRYLGFQEPGTTINVTFATPHWFDRDLGIVPDPAIGFFPLIAESFADTRISRTNVIPLTFGTVDIRKYSEVSFEFPPAENAELAFEARDYFLFDQIIDRRNVSLIQSVSGVPAAFSSSIPSSITVRPTVPIALDSLINATSVIANGQQVDLNLTALQQDDGSIRLSGLNPGVREGTITIQIDESNLTTVGESMFGFDTLTFHFTIDAKPPTVLIDRSTDVDGHSEITVVSSDDGEGFHRSSGLESMSVYRIDHDGRLRHFTTTSQQSVVIRPTGQSLDQSFYATADDKFGNRSVLNFDDLHETFRSISVSPDSLLPGGNLAIQSNRPEFLNFEGGWLLSKPLADHPFGSHRLHYANCEIRYFSLSKAQNPISRYDVNNDGEISSGDALVVINQIAQGVTTPDDFQSSFVYGDVNGDNEFSPIDVLEIINELSRKDRRMESEFVSAIEYPQHRKVDSDGNSNERGELIELSPEVAARSDSTARLTQQNRNDSEQIHDERKFAFNTTDAALDMIVAELDLNLRR